MIINKYFCSVPWNPLLAGLEFSLSPKGEGQENLDNPLYSSPTMLPQRLSIGAPQGAA